MLRTLAAVSVFLLLAGCAAVLDDSRQRLEAESYQVHTLEPLGWDPDRACPAGEATAGAAYYAATTPAGVHECGVVCCTGLGCERFARTCR